MYKVAVNPSIHFLSLQIHICGIQVQYQFKIQSHICEIHIINFTNPGASQSYVKLSRK